MDKSGEPLAPHPDHPELVRNPEKLVRDPDGRPYRQWREHIDSPEDIWAEMQKAADLPGLTSAPMLQPIETRLIMLQEGMTAATGLKVRAPDLKTLDKAASALEEELRKVDGIRAETVRADRVVGKPYLEVVPDREALARYGVSMEKAQRIIAMAIGGRKVTTTVEGRKRFPVEVRYAREKRQTPEQIEQARIQIRDGESIPIGQVADIQYRRGPQMIRTEDTFLTANVIFQSKRGRSDVEVIQEAKKHLADFDPPSGVTWRFAGRYEQHLQAQRTLAVVLPLALATIFLILYLQFSSVATTLNVFSAIALAWAGGFLLIYLYGVEGFADISVYGTNLRELFHMGGFEMTIAVWVGFLAVFGIAVDAGVLLATHLDQTFTRHRPQTKRRVRALVVQAARRRIRPCMMMTATTVLALLPVLTATGAGADVMIPMAIPSVGGMFFVVLTLLTVPVIYSLGGEAKCKRR